MATTFGQKKPVVVNHDGSSSQNVIQNTQTPRNTPSSIGSRIEPKDSYIFIAGSQAEFKATFTDTDKPIQVDVGNDPIAYVYQGDVNIAALTGELVDGQTYEYRFLWAIPIDIDLRQGLFIEYRGTLGGVEYVWGSEYFRVRTAPLNVKLKQPAYATVEELRQDKFNIDSYLPIDLRQDTLARDNLLHQQLVTSTKWLNGQLNLRDFHSSYNDNFNLFVRYYSVWSVLGQAMGEEGVAVSQKTLDHWEKKWAKVLKQIKMHSQLSNIPSGRA